MVPVSGELYGTSRVPCASGYWGGGGAGLARRSLSAWPPMAVSAPGCAGAAWGGGGGVVDRPRRAPVFSLIFAICSLTCFHPNGAVSNTAHIHSLPRRISSLHRVKDA